MNLRLHSQFTIHNSPLKITGSKSETNRLLLLQALYPNLELKNISDSDDSKVMAAALKGNDEVIDIHHAGTAMRFLTAYFAIQQGRTVTLTGSARMKERPIEILVDALRQLGAQIDYVENEGFPPLKIYGQTLSNNQVTLKADVSSQYISALLLIAPHLESGLELTLEGEITSIPYIKMTLAQLEQLGIRSRFEGNIIQVFPQLSIINYQLSIESDWSSASYFYSLLALSQIGTQITLSTFKQDSFQGDSALAEIYKDFGIETTFHESSILLTKRNCQLSIVNYQLNNTPDIAQTIAVTCFGLGIGCHLTGLHTLKIKETDRLEALKTELSKLGANVTITDDSLTMDASDTIKSGVTIKTYDDHRMAMAFATLAVKTDIIIENAEVVSKSYPDFWDHLRQIGIKITS